MQGADLLNAQHGCLMMRPRVEIIYRAEFGFGPKTKRMEDEPYIAVGVGTS